jgi:ATP-binding protein involved in chromosome partitioning
VEPTPPPTAIRRLPAEQALEIVWPDGLARRLNLVELRAQCMCARCVDEITGRRIVEIDGIDPGIAVSDMQLVGNYALRIHWSDGHHQGLYTWRHLRELCEAASH